jgi:starch-binding outer membrane protein, SusD/RagB family
MKRYKIFSIAFVCLIAINACVKDLNVLPSDPRIITSATIYDNPDAWKMVLAKCYAGLSLSGQQGPAGKPDISDIDEGFSTYLRQLWCATELPTDEAVIAWNDDGLKDYHNQNWGASNPFVTAMYNRIYYQISLLNEYIRAINARIDGLPAALKTNVTMYKAEARFLRAYSYWNALDMYGSVPFVTEADVVGKFLPKQISKDGLFNYIESELKAIDADLAAPRTNEYGRVDKAAAWMLLGKLYLNAEVYIGQPKYTECIDYTTRVINSGYTLDPVYKNMFTADNNKSPEIIFPVTFDGNSSRTYGGMTFVVHAEVGGSMSASSFGLDGGWGGNRVTSAFVAKFNDPSGNTDTRAMFYTDGQTLEIADLSNFTNGYAVRKFSNVTSDGTAGSNATFVDTDYPVFRLADAYLMYAEAVLRGGTGGTVGDALNYVNALRERAYLGTSGNIGQSDLTLSFILDERARELYWEGHRRTDLVRYGLLTSGDYLWPWKGGVAAGRATDSKYNILPIPSSDLGANPTLTPTPGY